MEQLKTLAVLNGCPAGQPRASAQLTISQLPDKSLTVIDIMGAEGNAPVRIPAFKDGRERRVVEAVERLAAAIVEFANDNPPKPDAVGVLRGTGELTEAARAAMCI